MMDADTALMRAYGLGMDEAGWTDEVLEEADKLLPTLVAAGYAAVDDETSTSYTWRFTDEGVARIREIEKSAVSQHPSERRPPLSAKSTRRTTDVSRPFVSAGRRLFLAFVSLIFAPI